MNQKSCVITSSLRYVAKTESHQREELQVFHLVTQGVYNPSVQKSTLKRYWETRQQRKSNNSVQCSEKTVPMVFFAEKCSIPIPIQRQGRHTKSENIMLVLGWEEFPVDQRNKRFETSIIRLVPQKPLRDIKCAYAQWNHGKHWKSRKKT